MANPTIRPVLDLIDIAQQNGTIGSINLPKLLRTSGYEKGGYTGTSSSSTATVIASEAKQPATDKALMALLAETRDLLQNLKNDGVKASMYITEFEKVQAFRNKSRALGSR